VIAVFFILCIVVLNYYSGVVLQFAFGVCLMSFTYVYESRCNRNTTELALPSRAKSTSSSMKSDFSHPCLSTVSLNLYTTTTPSLKNDSFASSRKALPDWVAH
jgi:hypothetical protein